MKYSIDHSHPWGIVEIAQPLHLHGRFLSRESAEKFLKETVPEYCRLGYYMDKTLVPESFMVINCNKEN